MRTVVTIDGEDHAVEGEDVLAWSGRDPATAGSDAAAEVAADYVRANPRPEPDAQGAANVPARQRMALLRRLAAGPATRPELLRAMRDGAGWVGASDWRNRMDELRGHGQRGGGHTPLPIVHDERTGRYRLTEPFAALDDEHHTTLRGLLAHLRECPDAPQEAAVLLEELFPGLEDGSD